MKTGRNYLVYAVILGGLAAGAAAWYVSKAEAAANPTESVVVARMAIPARTVLLEDWLVVKKVPKGAIHPEAASTMDAFVGKTTKQTIIPGEQILASKLFRVRSESGASFVLPEGHRALAISVNELIAAGGLILPGDKVDVLGSCVVDVRDQERTMNLARSVYSLQKIEVLAVAQDVMGEEAVGAHNALRAQDASNLLAMPRDPQSKPTAKTVTLALTPDESQKLVLLENHPDCQIRLALRGAGDDSKWAPVVIDFDPFVSMDAIVKP
ncbi:MAG: Flp pilus assembly protein CpaB [Chloroflexi bacterium]|nr:Flp pilus assembly protein CpaB [Chloroflexota bacterium]